MKSLHRLGQLGNCGLHLLVLFGNGSDLLFKFGIELGVDCLKHRILETIKGFCECCVDLAREVVLHALQLSSLGDELRLKRGDALGDVCKHS